MNVIMVQMVVVVHSDVDTDDKNSYCCDDSNYNITS